jgi:hypothetical protein
MARVNDFYSVDESAKSPVNRMYHNNGFCLEGHAIPLSDRKRGSGGYRLCDCCKDFCQQELRDHRLAPMGRMRMGR